MKPAAFRYHRAGSAEEAAGLLAELGDEAKLLAGGQSLVPMMNFRLLRPSALVDISRLKDLSYIRPDGDGICIGALTRHIEVQEMPAGLAPGFEVLPKAAALVGHYSIRCAGTFGGSIAHADPSSEWCAIALLLDAEISALGPKGFRVIHAEDFFKGFLTTDLLPDEMLVEVRLPRPPSRAGLREFSRRAGDFAVVLAAAAVDLDGKRCTGARIVLGGVAPRPIRVREAESVLIGERLDASAADAAAVAAASVIDPPADIHGSSEYRRAVAQTMLKSLLLELSDEST